MKSEELAGAAAGLHFKLHEDNRRDEEEAEVKCGVCGCGEDRGEEEAARRSRVGQEEAPCKTRGAVARACNRKDRLQFDRRTDGKFAMTHYASDSQ